MLRELREITVSLNHNNNYILVLKVAGVNRSFDETLLWYSIWILHVAQDPRRAWIDCTNWIRRKYPMHILRHTLVLILVHWDSYSNNSLNPTLQWHPQWHFILPGLPTKDTTPQTPLEGFQNQFSEHRGGCNRTGKRPPSGLRWITLLHKLRSLESFCNWFL